MRRLCSDTAPSVGRYHCSHTPPKPLYGIPAHFKEQNVFLFPKLDTGRRVENSSQRFFFFGMCAPNYIIMLFGYLVTVVSHYTIRRYSQFERPLFKQSKALYLTTAHTRTHTTHSLAHTQAAHPQRKIVCKLSLISFIHTFMLIKWIPVRIFIVVISHVEKNGTEYAQTVLYLSGYSKPWFFMCI